MAIVGTLAIDVMHGLVREEFPAEARFHHQAVLLVVNAAVNDDAISVFVDPASPLRIVGANARTEALPVVVASVDRILRSKCRLAALFAGESRLRILGRVLARFRAKLPPRLAWLA